MHLKLLFEAIIALATVQQCTIAHSTRSPYLNEILSALAGLQPTRNHQVPAAVFPNPDPATILTLPEHPSNLIIISEHTSLWHYYNDCCSKIHNAPDSNTMFPLAAARRC